MAVLSHPELEHISWQLSVPLTHHCLTGSLNGGVDTLLLTIGLARLHSGFAHEKHSSPQFDHCEGG